MQNSRTQHEAMDTDHFAQSRKQWSHAVSAQEKACKKIEVKFGGHIVDGSILLKVNSERSVSSKLA